MAKNYDQWYEEIMQNADTVEHGINTICKLMRKRESWADATAYRKDKKWFYKTGQYLKNKEKKEVTDPYEYISKLSYQQSINKIIQAVHAYAMTCDAEAWIVFCQKKLQKKNYQEPPSHDGIKLRPIRQRIHTLLKKLRTFICMYIEQDATIDDDVKEYIKRVSKKNKKSKR